jgi:hypothetical protein
MSLLVDTSLGPPCPRSTFHCPVLANQLPTLLAIACTVG